MRHQEWGCSIALALRVSIHERAQPEIVVGYKMPECIVELS